ncbi:hypothetical protein AB5I41_09655 [Sphingomonas sp. MMS24-JH45]
MAVKLVQADGCATGASTQASLVKQIGTAWRWWTELKRGELDVTRLADREQVTASYVTRTLRLAFLPPTVTQKVLAGQKQALAEASPLKLCRTAT